MAVLTDIIKEDALRVCSGAYNGLTPIARGLVKGIFYGTITPFALVSGVKGIKKHSNYMETGPRSIDFFARVREEASTVWSYAAALSLGFPVAVGVAFAHLPDSNKFKYFGILAATNVIDMAAHYAHSVYKRCQERKIESAERA
jgi:hypothetical protein